MDHREVVEHLASFERGSASEGERRAAEWIAARLRSLGLEAQVEEERAHGTFWWPVGLLSLLAALGGLLRRRWLGALAFLGLWEELQIRSVITRRFLPKRPTWNVVAHAGDPDGDVTVVVSSHHDAPHASAFMDPRPTRALLTRYPWISQRLRTWPRMMAPLLLGPLAVTLGFRRFGTAASLASVASMTDMALRPVVPGANDNLSAVATVLGVAERLVADPPEGVRVILLSTGSEESLEEGMWAFVQRHDDDLPRDRTSYLVVEMVGSPLLVIPEGEGFVYEHAYDASLKDLLSEVAAEAGIEAVRGQGVAFSSDASVPINRGEPVAVPGSYDELKLPVAYHWPDDTPDKLHYGSIDNAVTIIEGAVRRIAERSARVSQPARVS
jgi:Peptidase family M28